MPTSLSISSLKSRATLAWKLPLIALGIALVTTISGAAWLQIASERKGMLQSLAQETNNLGLIFEQNTERTASEIDRIIRYLRASYERNGFKADWPTLVQEEFTANRRTVQIAIMDASGMMITSSKMLRPERQVDLSDREHFRIHANAKQFVDRLFISKPVLGRASNKWSVQFTRPYRNREGHFAGVIVVSLDPEFLTRNFAALKLGADGGLAIVGDDGIVRAGAGIFLARFGQPIGNEVPLPPQSRQPQQHIHGNLRNRCRTSRDRRTQPQGFPFAGSNGARGRIDVQYLPVQQKEIHLGGQHSRLCHHSGCRDEHREEARLRKATRSSGTP